MVHHITASHTPIAYNPSAGLVFAHRVHPTAHTRCITPASKCRHDGQLNLLPGHPASVRCDSTRNRTQDLTAESVPRSCSTFPLSRPTCVRVCREYILYKLHFKTIFLIFYQHHPSPMDYGLLTSAIEDRRLLFSPLSVCYLAKRRAFCKICFSVEMFVYLFIFLFFCYNFFKFQLAL